MSRLNTFLKRGAAIVFAAVLFGISIIYSFEEFINEYQTGTIVGNIDLSGKEKSEVNYEIVLGINDYISEYYVNFVFDNKSYIIEGEIISADISATVNSISNGKRSPVFYSLDSNFLKEELENKINPKYIDLVDFTSLEEVILRSLQDNDPFTNINLHNYIDSFESLVETLNVYDYTDFSEDNIIDNIDSGSFIIVPNSRFFLSDNIHELFLSNKELTILATGIQAITINTNFTSFVKSNSTSPTYDEVNDFDIYNSYINLARGKDLSFFNPHNFEYEIRYYKLGNTLRFELSGVPFENVYTHKVVRTDYPHLSYTGPIESIGRDGISYEIVRYIDRNGVLLLDETVYTNFYAPVPEITVNGG